jgi:hypothetical protein
MSNSKTDSFQLILSGWCGLLLMTCCRYHYPGTTQAGCVFPVKTKHIVSTHSYVLRLTRVQLDYVDVTKMHAC